MKNNDMDLNRQKVTMALYLLKENNEQELLKEWELYIGKKYILGRGKDSDIDIDSLLLSRRHIELIYYSSNLIQIKDLNSRNGTYINNSKVEPNKEIKFSVKDKLSLGETNNKLTFVEKKEENPNNNVPVNRKIETNKINNINNNNYNNNYNSNYNNNYMRRNRRYNGLNRVIRSQPQSQNNDDEYVSKLIKELKSGNNNFNYIQNRRRFTPYNRFNKRRSSFSFTQIRQNREKENQNVFMGRKVERNNNNIKNDNENVFKSKKDGLEQLKKKLKSVDANEDETEKDGEEDEEEEESEDLDDIIDIDEKEHKNEKIILKTNKLNKLEFTVPLKGKNLKNLKGIKKVKCLVSGYVVLNVKKKKLIYE